MAGRGIGSGPECARRTAGDLGCRRGGSDRAGGGATADVLLIDERRGRIAARDRHLKVAVVLGELLHAKFSGQLPSVREEMRKLRSEARFFIRADIENFILSQAGE